MSAAGDPPPGQAEPGEPGWVRRRRLAAVFGEVLPQTTADERDDRPPAETAREAEDWLREQIPPHHG